MPCFCIKRIQLFEDKKLHYWFILRDVYVFVLFIVAAQCRRFNESFSVSVAALLILLLNSNSNSSNSSSIDNSRSVWAGVNPFLQYVRAQHTQISKMFFILFVCIPHLDWNFKNSFLNFVNRSISKRRISSSDLKKKYLGIITDNIQ